MKKLSKLYESLFTENKLIELQLLIEREIKVGDALISKLKSVGNNLSNKMLNFLNSDNIKDTVSVDYVDYNPENENLLTLGFKDREGNDRTKLMKITKLMTYLGSNLDGVKGYELEELISHLKKGDLDDFKIVNGDDILKAYHCENYDEGETMGSCMRYSSAQEYLKIYTDNPNQISCLVLFNTKNNKVRGRALIWTLDDGTKFMDKIYMTNNEYKKNFITYANKYNLSTNIKGGTVTLDNKGIYKYYPYMDTLMYYTPDTGVLSPYHGELTLQDTQGGDSTGVWSEVHSESIPEDEAMYIEHVDSYVYDHEVVEAWSRDGTYLYKDSDDVVEITKGDYRGWHALREDVVYDYNNEILIGEECYMLEAGTNEGYWCFEGDAIMDFDDKVIMREEAVTATIGSLKGETILDEDAYIFTSGPNEGLIFHEQDESEMEGHGEYKYINQVLSQSQYMLDETNRFSLGSSYIEIINERINHTNDKIR